MLGILDNINVLKQGIRKKSSKKKSYYSRTNG